MSAPYVVLHGGFHKTATSHIQGILKRNANHMRKRGVAYVDHRRTRKDYTVPCMLNAWTQVGIDFQRKVSREELDGLGRKLLSDAMAGEPGRIVISDENLAGHCGHCVSRGLLYRWNRRLMRVFAESLPLRVHEVHFGLRNYADFFAAAYVEYLRSAQGKNFVPIDSLKRNLLEKMPNWGGVLKNAREAFPDAQIVIWRHEDFKAVEPTVIGNLVGPGIDLSKLRPPKRANKRPTASHRAVEAFMHERDSNGLPSALAAWRGIQDEFPRLSAKDAFDPWTEAERRHLEATYGRDCEAVFGSGDYQTVLPAQGPVHA